MKYMLIYFNRQKKKYGIIKSISNLGICHNLQDLNIFTSMFQSEKELKDYLCQKNLLKKEYYDYDLSILMVKNNTGSLVRFGILYQDDIPYIDEDFIKNYFKAHINDEVFLGYFIDNFYDYLKNVNFFKEEIEYLKSSYDYLHNKNYLQEDTLKYLETFLNHYMYRKKDNKYKRCKNQIRELGLFIHSYERYIHPNYDIDEEQIEKEIENYNYILKERNITYEDEEAYNKRINKLERILRENTIKKG